MQLRVHGIGGTSPNSVLGAPADARLVPRWPAPPDRRAMAWYDTDPEVCVYHWANLTSGSRWFVVWPLLLPFTLLNVAGYMVPRGAVGRLLQGVHLTLCLVATVWFAGWFVFGGQVLAQAFSWRPWIGLTVSSVVALAMVVPTFLEPTWRPGSTTPPIAPGSRTGLEHPDFFRRSTAERALYTLHVAAVLVTIGGIVWWGSRGTGGRHHEVATDVVVGAGLLVAVLLVVLLIGAVIDVLGRRGSALWAFRAAGTVVVATGLIGGLMVALLRVVVSDDDLFVGGPFATFDVYGLAVLATIGVFATGAVVVLSKPAPGELVPGLASRLLPNPMSWFRARVAELPGAAAIALGAAAAMFLAGTLLLYPSRAPLPEWVPGSLGEDGTPNAPAEVWRLGEGPLTVIAQTTIFGLFSMMALNLWRSWGSRQKLRAVGSVWDVLSFWPRRFHPFAVRPYSGYAVNQLRFAMYHRPDERWGEPLTVFAHSQGTIIAAAALAAQPTRDHDHDDVRAVDQDVDHHDPDHDEAVVEGRGSSTGSGGPPATVGVTTLVTAGSPIRSLYMNAFPRYFHEDLLGVVAGALAKPGGSWTNVFRFTDHIGRTVFRTEADFTPDPSGCSEARWCSPAPDHLVVGGAVLRDCALADPAATQASVQGHNDYFSDPRLVEVLP